MSYVIEKAVSYVIEEAVSFERCFIVFAALKFAITKTVFVFHSFR